MNSPIISVIVPVYNVEKYIRRCLDSLVAQTCKDFEIITVDDGSPDRSGIICDDYARKYNSIRSLHKSNGGLSSARNYGIRSASAEWIAFVDSDDWMEPNFIEKCIISLSEHSECDCISYGYHIDYSDSNYSLDRRYSETRYFERIKVPNAIENMEKNGMFNSVCNKLYRNSLLQKYQLRFTEKMEPGEDLLFNCKYFIHVKCCVLLHDQFYHYMRQDENTLTKKYDPNLRYKIIEFDQARVDLYSALGMKADCYQNYIYMYYYCYVMSSLYNNYSVSSSLSDLERRKYLQEIFEDNKLKEAIKVINNPEEKKKGYEAIFAWVYRVKNPVIGDAVYSVLFWMRNKFKRVYNKYRALQLK